MRAALADLVRREVLEVSADKLSPQRGTYRFAQEMLRQVAYDTISRQDRKARHLVVAAHLRATFPSDGDEMIDVVARHYLDALAAVPDAADADAAREQAIVMLTRSAERANRTGAQGRAAESFAAAAALAAQVGGPEAEMAAADLWERAAQAARDRDDWDGAVEHAGRARETVRDTR